MSMERLDRLFKALADPTRLRILNLLLAEPGCVCEMEAVLATSQPLISRHVAHLRNAGLVLDRRQGMRVNYSVRLEGREGAVLQRCLRGLFLSREEYRVEAEAWCRRTPSDCANAADARVTRQARPRVR
ncbi:MAG: metalloregulator ArsR/SmtB family transcription factor [Acidobacteriota bacterium]|mgnify:FL=1